MRDYETEKAAVGRRIATAMGKRVQDVVAQRVGVSQATVSRWMRGESLPEIVTLRRLADELGVPAAWIMQPLLGEVADPDAEAALRDLDETRRAIDRLESRIRGLSPHGA